MTNIQKPDQKWNGDLREGFGQLAVGEMRDAPDEINTEGRPKGRLHDVFDMRLLKVGPGAALVEMALKEVHMNQRGVAQAGAIVALADAAAGWATTPALAAGMSFTTLELKCNMLRAARVGEVLHAVVKPIHVGSSTVVLDVLVYKRETPDKPVAKFSCTQLVLKAKS
jgi:1,4-dihydroxy-2-naphthoyl-CoA hydrolase